VIIAASVASDTWNQYMIEFMVDQWSDNVLTDIMVVDDRDSCPSGYSSISATFHGQYSYCYNYNGNYITIGTCSSKKQKSSNRKEYIYGVESQKMKRIMGRKICFARADDWDYEDIVQWRAGMGKNGTCKASEVLCGGGTTSDTNYCVKKDDVEDNGNKCPINDFKYVKKDIDDYVYSTNSSSENYKWEEEDPYFNGTMTY